MIHYENNHPTFKIYQGNNLTFLPHMHQEIEILHVKKGSMQVTHQHTTYTLTDSDTILIMPHILHGYRTLEPSEHVICIFKPSLIPHYQSFMTMQCQTPVILGKDLHPDIPFYLNALLAPETLAEIGLQKGYLYVLFTRLIALVDFITAKCTPHTDLLYKCLEYIHLHFKEPITLPILAQYLGVSPNYVSKFFNQSIGYSLTYYINTLRIDYAKYLLKETTLPITEISFECGYESLRHFNRTFKELTGHAPREGRF